MEKAKGNGLPRHSFVDDSFFNDFDERKNHHKRFNSTSKIFDDNFFNKMGHFNFEPSFIRSSFKKRPDIESPLKMHRSSSTLQHSPTFLNKNHSYSESPNSPNAYHQRQSSCSSNYSNNLTPNNKTSNSQTNNPNLMNNKKDNEKVHVIHVQQSPQTNVEINNNGSPKSYVNKQNNPEKSKNYSNSFTTSQINKQPNNPEKNSIKNYKKQNECVIPAISDIPIPLPPPTSKTNTTLNIPILDENITNSETNNENGNIILSDNVKKNNIEELLIDKESQKNNNKEQIYEPFIITNEQLIKILDNTERRVEQLREKASQLEAERESVLDVLQNIRVKAESLHLEESEQEDINMTTERLLKRCKAVDVIVITPRNEEQARALAEVNKMIDEVLLTLRNNIVSTKDKIERLLNACSPDEPSGPIDQRFQTMIVACTADDQKKIRRRLTKLINQIERNELTCS